MTMTDQTDKQLAAALGMLEGMSEHRRDQLLGAMKPELAAACRDALGLKPWEGTGMSRATWYRERRKIVYTLVGEMGKAEDGWSDEEAAQLVKRKTQTNSDMNRARAAIKRLTDEDFIDLMDEELKRRGYGE